MVLLSLIKWFFIRFVCYCGHFLLNRSTDSEMKLWDVNTGRCLKTYHGHKNDKNFVGLTVNGNHIVCGK